MTGHALRSRNRAGEDVADRVAALLLALGCGPFITVIALEVTVAAVFAGDGRIDRGRLPVAAVLRIAKAVARFAVVGVDHVAARTARMAIVARLVVGSHEPQERIVEPGLVNVEDRDRHPQPGAGAAVGLLEVGPSGFFEPLDLSAGIWQADLGKGAAVGPPTVFEHPEYVPRWHHVPARQRIERGQRAARCLALGDLSRRIAGRHQLGRLAAAGIGLAEGVVLERDNPVVVSRAAPQHRPAGHQRAFPRFDRRQVASSASFARNAVVARIDETNELRRLAVKQGVAVLGIGR